MWKSLREFVRQYDVCQRYKLETVASPRFLQPLLIPQFVFTDIIMDFIEGLPKSKGKNVIFVVVDSLTKYAHFMPLSHPYTTVSVAQIFLDNVYKLHGLPATIISDKDPTFMSNFWQEFFKM